MEKQKLADQALEKSKQGIPLSRAEKSALARTNFSGAFGELIRGSEIVRTIERQEELLKAGPAQRLLLQREVPTTREEFLTSLFQRQGARVRREGDILFVESAARQLDFKDLQFVTTLTGEPEPGFLEPRKPSVPFIEPIKPGTPRTIGGLISARREVPIIKTIDLGTLQPAELTEEQEKRLKAAREEQKLFEQSFKAKFGTNLEQIAATLSLKGIPRLKKAAPAIFGFGALSFLFPPAAGALAFASIPSATKQIQAEIAREGVTKTIAAEAPTLIGFALAAKGGILARGVAINRLQTFRNRLRLKERLSPSELLELQRLEKAVKDTRGVQPEVKKINIRDVERLSPRSAKVLEKVIIDNKQTIVIGGSVATRTQIPGSRKPVDLDLFTSKEPGTLVRDIVKDLRKAGVKRVSGVRDKQITIEGKKAIEVKRLGLITDNIKKVQTPFEVFDSGLIETPRGVRVLKAGIQIRRKLVGGFGLEGARRRLKDIPDLGDIASSLFKTKIERAREAEILPDLREGIVQRQQLRFLGLEPRRIRPGDAGELRFGRREERALFEEEEVIADVLFGKQKDLKILDESLPSGIRGRRPSRGGLLPSTDSLIETLKPRDISSILAVPKERLSILAPSIKELPSILAPLAPSKLFPTVKERPSIIEPAPPPEIPSILKMFEEEAPSILDPFEKDFPSILQPPITDVESLLKPDDKIFPSVPFKDPGKLFITKDLLEPQRPGYDVFVRRGEKRGDRFIKVADNLPFNRAVGRGSDVVDNFIEASFKILKSGKKTSVIETFFPDLFKFRQPKGKTKLTQDVFVERRKHRLDSIGEVAQISFFKEQARKKKEGSFLPSLNNLLFDTGKSVRLRL